MSTSDQDARRRFCEKFMADMAKLFLDKDSCDVTFELPDGVVRAHKSILTARVPVMEKMFGSGLEESKTNKVKIVDSDANSFDTFLRFVYSGELPDDAFHGKLARSLIVLANKYDVPDLVSHIKPKLKKRLEQVADADLLEEVNELTQLWELYNYASIKELCQEVLLKRFNAAFTSRGKSKSKPAFVDFAIAVLVFAHVHHVELLKKYCFKGLREAKLVVAGETARQLKAHPDLLVEMINDLWRQSANKNRYSSSSDSD